MLYSRSLLFIHLKYSSVYMLTPSSLTVPSSYSVKKHYFIYLCAMPNLSDSMQDLPSLLPHVESLVVACRLLVAAHTI